MPVYPESGLPLYIAFLVLLISPLAHAENQRTFYRDVLPILQRRCQSCHRPGEIGPMPLITYRQVRPWAKAIRESVKLKKMPPWFADPRWGRFANDPSLSAEEIQTIERWATNGAPAGGPSDAPPVITWPRDWSIRPDIQLEMPKAFPIPAKATIDYQYLILPLNFKEDRWIAGAQIRPSDPSVVHHAVLYVREPKSAWLHDVPIGVMYAPPKSDSKALRQARDTKEDILAIYTPGAVVSKFPNGMAKKIPAGADLVLQFHYTSKSTEAQDRTRIALELTTKPAKRLLTLQMGKDDLLIPPDESDYRGTVSGTLPNDALLVSLFPHMHLRGSAFDFEIVAPGGRVEPLLRVKPFNFYWQLSYIPKEPRFLPKGTRLRWTGYFDNSANNPRNPDPNAEVRWGEQSWEEMMIGFFDVAVDPDIDKKQFFIR